MFGLVWLARPCLGVGLACWTMFGGWSGLLDQVWVDLACSTMFGGWSGLLDHVWGLVWFARPSLGWSGLLDHVVRQWRGSGMLD